MVIDPKLYRRFQSPEKYPLHGGRTRRVFVCPLPCLCFSFRIQYDNVNHVLGFDGGEW